jgi:disease resistance protein RPM1
VEVTEIVLDDVWNAHLWYQIRHALLDDGTRSRVVITTRNSTRSRVVITTRNRYVAMAAAPERVKMLEPMPEAEAWELFCAVAFRDRRCPTHLEELATSMVRRCCGLPLAIVSVGNLLALRETTDFAWRNAHDSLVWDKSSSDLGIGEAAAILNLSIDDLPHHLKKCFLSCSVFPEDLLMKRKMLLRNWVAQGFVEEQLGQRKAEDVADDYLDQIVQRNLFQVVHRNEFGRVKHFTTQDLIRDLIIYRSKLEEGFLQLLKGKVTMECNARIRHLVVDRCEHEDSKFFSQWTTLRTFTAYGSGLDASTLSHFRPRF